MLYGIITCLGPISGAHFNPAVSLAFWLRGDLPLRDFIAYVPVQIAGGILGVLMTHVMYDLPVFQVSTTVRSAPNLWVSECVATFGLLFVIFGGLRFNAAAVPMLVGLYITGAYWFTSSTSFANPAVTIARGFSDTFAGIAPSGIAMFIACQLATAVVATFAMGYLFTKNALYTPNTRKPEC